jgi:heme/copper-type cytochrome/quinol oxidase subunit 2
MTSADVAESKLWLTTSIVVLVLIFALVSAIAAVVFVARARENEKNDQLDDASSNNTYALVFGILSVILAFIGIGAYLWGGTKAIVNCGRENLMANINANTHSYHVQPEQRLSPVREPDFDYDLELDLLNRMPPPPISTPRREYPEISDAEFDAFASTYPRRPPSRMGSLEVDFPERTGWTTGTGGEQSVRLPGF